MCTAAVSGILLHRRKLNWSITCDHPESGSVLPGAFLFCQVYIQILPQMYFLHSINHLDEIGCSLLLTTNFRDMYIICDKMVLIFKQ